MRRQAIVATNRLADLGLIRRDRPTDLLRLEIGWLLCLPRFQGKEIELDQFQVRFLTTRAKFRSVLKARQVGFSFGIGAECLARCHLKPRHTAVCISYNLDDAKEKIALVKELHDELPLEFQKKIVIDSKTEVGFAGRDSKRRISRIHSWPSKAPRGKTGDVYLDELAHCQNDKAIYGGATALIARSGGQLTIGSTPLGRRGVFHAVHTQEFERYPGFWRQEVPWWLCRQFCREIEVAAVGAPSLPTEERVKRYGTESLRDQFEALPLEDFQQEFELAFQDERVSFFPYDLILPCAQKEKHEVPVFENLERLARAAPDMGPLYIGFDVGRTNHPSELVVCELQGATFVLRYEESYKNVQFPVQRARLVHVGRTLGEFWKRWRIDRSGLGRNLSEDLVLEFGGRVEPVDFSMDTKTELANSFKILLEEKNIVLYRDRSLTGQIHSIKQRITASGNAIFDAEKNRHHHADKFWALALATRVRRKRQPGPVTIGVRTLGAKRDPARVADARPRGSSDMEALLAPPPAVAGARPVSYAESASTAAPTAERDVRSADDRWLERRARVLDASLEHWRARGDAESVATYGLERERVLAELARRAAPGADPVAGEGEE